MRESRIAAAIGILFVSMMLTVMTVALNAVTADAAAPTSSQGAGR